jgi:pimeloyl-ACP methyl ester carboxylesterase
MHSIINKYKNREIILVGYSMGAIAGLALAAQHKNIKAVYAMYPAFYIQFFG